MTSHLSTTVPLLVLLISNSAQRRTKGQGSGHCFTPTPHRRKTKCGLGCPLFINFKCLVTLREREECAVLVRALEKCREKRGRGVGERIPRSVRSLPELKCLTEWAAQVPLDVLPKPSNPHEREHLRITESPWFSAEL